MIAFESFIETHEPLVADWLVLKAVFPMESRLMLKRTVIINTLPLNIWPNILWVANTIRKQNLIWSVMDRGCSIAHRHWIAKTITCHVIDIDLFDHPYWSISFAQHRPALPDLRAWWTVRWRRQHEPYLPGGHHGGWGNWMFPTKMATRWYLD